MMWYEFKCPNCRGIIIDPMPAPDLSEGYICRMCGESFDLYSSIGDVLAALTTIEVARVLEHEKNFRARYSANDEDEDWGV